MPGKISAGIVNTFSAAVKVHAQPRRLFRDLESEQVIYALFPPPPRIFATFRVEDMHAPRSGCEGNLPSS